MPFSGRIIGFDDDIEIVHIGSLFKYENNPRWFIHVWFNPIQEKTHVSFSQMPLLARSRIFNQTNREDSELETGAVNFNNQISLEETRLSECPVLELEKYSVREPPRICRRLHFLRGWSNEQTQTLSPGDPGTGCAPCP